MAANSLEVEVFCSNFASEVISSVSRKETETGRLKNKLKVEQHNRRLLNRALMVNSKRVGIYEFQNAPEKFSCQVVQQLAQDLKQKKDTKKSLKQLINAFTLDTNISVFLSVNGSLACLTGLISAHHSDFVVEATTCIVNMATGCHKTTFVVLKAMAPYLITYLHGNNHHLQDLSAWALGNIAADCNSCRKHLKTQGLLPALLSLLETQNPNVLESVLFALKNYTRFNIHDNEELCNMELVEKCTEIISLFQSSKVTTLSLVSSLLFNISSSYSQTERYFKEATICIMVKMCHHFSQKQEFQVNIVTPLLRCLGNLACGDCNPTLNLLNGPFLETVILTLDSPHAFMKRESLWLISNLVLNINSPLPPEAITKLLKSIEPLLYIHMESQVKEEVLYFLCALYDCRPQHFEEAQKMGLTY